MKIFLDTDIGTNIDDSFALAYLLKKDPNSLIGIGTVTGDTLKRAGIADNILKFHRIRVPVLAGAEKPLFGKIQPSSAQIPLVIDAESQEKSNIIDEYPWQFLADAADKAPGEITVICIGPLTNMALMGEKRPASFNRLKEIRLMAGMFRPVDNYHKPVESNANCDPHALQVIMDKAQFPVYATGVDVTISSIADFDEMEEKLRGRNIPYLLSQLKTFRRIRDNLILHDLMIIVSLFTEVLSFLPVSITVELCKLDKMGETRYGKPAPNIERFIAFEADIDKFWQEVNSILF